MSEPQNAQDPFGLSGTTIEGKYRVMKGRSQKADAGMNVADFATLLDPTALAVAHGQKIAHCGAKPANLFVTHVGGKCTASRANQGRTHMAAA